MPAEVSPGAVTAQRSRVCVLRAQVALEEPLAVPPRPEQEREALGSGKTAWGWGLGWDWLEGHAGPGKSWLQVFLPALPHPSLTPSILRFISSRPLPRRSLFFISAFSSTVFIPSGIP